MWIDTLKYHVVGNQQKTKTFWEKVAETYNMARPLGQMELLYGPTRSSRLNIKLLLQSTIRTQRLKYVLESKQDNIKPFMYVLTWEKVHYVDKWAGGVESNTSFAYICSKHTASGQSFP